MTTLREAAQQALEALTYVTRHFTRTPSTLKDSDARAMGHEAITALRAALAEHDKADTINGLEDEFRHNIRQTQDRIRAALEQPEPDIYSIPANKKEPRPGLVNLEEFPGFIYESSNGWHIGDMKVVKWLLNNREADYWEQFKEGA